MLRPSTLHVKLTQCHASPWSLVTQRRRLAHARFATHHERSAFARADGLDEAV